MKVVMQAIMSIALLAFLGQPVLGAETGAKPASMVAGKCISCHGDYKEKKDIVAGDFQSLSIQAKTFQVEVGDRMQLIKYTDQTTVKNVPDLKSLKKPIPVRVTVAKVGEDLVASEIVAKPQIKVPDNQIISTKDLEKLVAMGPEKGKYTLVDSRPEIKFAEGHIPTAIPIPFPKMGELKEMLPKDKGQLLIFLLRRHEVSAESHGGQDGREIRLYPGEGVSCWRP